MPFKQGISPRDYPFAAAAGCEPIGRWRGDKDRTRHPFAQRFRPESAIESAAKLGEIARQMAGDNARMTLGNARGVLPYSVLIDENGRIAAQKLGEFTENELLAWVNN